jgi:PAS domain S-box-containing protein
MDNPLFSEPLLKRLQDRASAQGLTPEAYVERLLDEDAQTAPAPSDEIQRRYRGIVDSAIDLVCRYAPDTTVLFANDAYCEYFDRPQEQIIGYSFLEYSDPENVDGIKQRIAEVFADPSPSVRVFSNRSEDGTIRWIQWVDFGITDENGKVIEIQAVGRDITPLKEFEDELFQQQEHYRMLFEASPLPMWVYDIETLRFASVNRAAIHQYGFTHEEFMAMSITAIMAPVEAERLMSHLRVALQQSTSWKTEWQHRRKDGMLFDVEVSAHNFTFNGRQSRLVLVNDITERKLLEHQRLYAQSLELELQKEREIVELRDRFISLVSHEFRTPLAVIQSSVNILERYYDSLDRTRIIKRLGGIVDQVRRMVMMLDEVMAVSRDSTSAMGMEIQPVNLTDFSTRIIDTLKTLDEDRHIIELRQEWDTDTVEADPRLLEYILVNLLGNSLKYSEAGTTVYFDVTHAPGALNFSIRDEGIGIPELDLETLFAPFHRGSNVGQIPGIGLGLSIVRQSVERHGGSIQVSSKVGRGTQFTVRIPVNAAQLAPARS